MLSHHHIMKVYSRCGYEAPSIFNPGISEGELQ